jgi:DNA-binding NarL/FixJ family response regulator
MMEANSEATTVLGRSTASTAKVRLLIAEDHPALRETLRSVLKQYPEIDIVGEATNGEDAVLRAEELQPEIVLMDISMPKLDGIGATLRIKAKSSRTAVLGLSVYSEGHLVDAMLKAGAVAVVLKERATEDLYDAIQRAIALAV